MLVGRTMTDKRRVENLRPGAMEKLGIGFDVLSKINPRIILASTSGYGAGGPYKNRAGYVESVTLWR